MKKLIAILSLTLLSFTQDEYSDGFESGYIDGFCFKQENCIEPIVPIPNLPDINCQDYRCGYNDGWEKGRFDAR